MAAWIDSGSVTLRMRTPSSITCRPLMAASTPSVIWRSICSRWVE